MRFDEGSFAVSDGTKLFFRSTWPDRPRADLLLLHGYGDHLGRYERFGEALASRGFAVHAFDQRGHGRSPGQRGYVARFDDYLRDLDAFIARLRDVSSHRKLFLFGHSHGALIATRRAIPPAHLHLPPLEVAGLVLSAPYIGLAIVPSKVKLAAARWLGRLIPSLPIRTEVKVEMLSHDLDWQRATLADPLYGWMATPRWFSESNAAQEEVMRRAEELALPLLIVQGTDDRVASIEATRAFFQRCGSTDKAFEALAGMRHEPWAEIGKEEVLGRILAWLEART